MDCDEVNDLCDELTTMNKLALMLAVTALSLAAPAARADSSAHILETEPPDGATLGRQESLWVRIEYRSEEPISLWARPYLNGKEVKEAISNASLTYVGAGEALGWFALIEPGDVDEIRIKAGGGKPYREWELARQPVRLRWTDTVMSAEQRAPWVEEALAKEQARYAEDARQRAAEPVTMTDTALFSGFMLTVLALLVAGISVPLWSVWKWRGGWRMAAAVPACAILFVVAQIVLDTASDPTSHNLWPFEILQVGVTSLLFVGLLKLMRRFKRVQD
jgi:hypothetical protein